MTEMQQQKQLKTPTKEQLRLAELPTQGREVQNTSEDITSQSIKKVVELTNCTSNEAEVALMDSEGIVEAAVALLDKPDEQFGCSPKEAIEFLDKKLGLGLNKDENEKIFRVLNNISEDPILVVRLNQQWITENSIADANKVFDAIANFQVGEGQRRDFQAHHLCFQFSVSSDIVNCREHILRQFPGAFAPSPEMLAEMEDLQIIFPGNHVPMGFCAIINRLVVIGDEIMPMGFCAVVNKLEVIRNDIMPFHFFHL